MTVIAAIATPTHTVIGSDIGTDYNGTLILRDTSKIIEVTADDGERILIGGAGNAALGPAVTRHLQIEETPNPNNADECDLWAAAVAEAITINASEANPSLVTTEGSFDGCLLMAWRQHLWYVIAHNAFRPNNGIAAIGSGCDAARGSIHTNIARGVPATQAVKEAIEWACVIDTGCRVDERGPLVHMTDQ